MQFAKSKTKLSCNTNFRESLQTLKDLKDSPFDKSISHELSHFNDDDVKWTGGKFDELFSPLTLSPEIKKIKPMQVKRSKRRVVAGHDGELNFDRLWSRKPYDAMTSKIKGSNVIKLSIEVSFSSHVNQSSINKFTVEVLKAVQTLIVSGYAVGIELTNTTTKVNKTKTHDFNSTIVIKKPDDSLSIQDISRVFTCNYYRRVILNLREQALYHYNLASRYSGVVIPKPYRVKFEKGTLYVGNKLDVTCDEILKEVKL